jgi:nucleotide-binding universal stress UspA family protein
MLRYMADVFAGNLFTPHIGYLFGLIVSFVFVALLLSAVNTAISALISLLFVMSRDGEMPQIFQNLNSFGVPRVPLLLATLMPMVLVFSIHDIAGLADLYAVGFVGAIATNLGATSTDWKLNLSKFERYGMFITFAIMAAIEITLLVDKPHARNFAISIVAAGLLLRGLVKEQEDKRWGSKKVPIRHYSVCDDDDQAVLHVGAMLCSVTHIGKTLEFAIEECKKFKQPLYVLYIREQQIITEDDRNRLWLNDAQACSIFDYAKDYLPEVSIKFIYTVSDSTAATIVDTAKDLHISRIILGMPRSSKFFQLIRGNIVREVGKIIPQDIDLLVIS